MIKAVVAWDKDTKGIGYRNQLPWPIIPEDMAHFRSLTVGSAVVMGGETFLSLGNTALPKRKNIVITRKKRKDFPENVIQITDPSQLLKVKYNLWVIGGASIYSLLMDACIELQVTELVFENSHKLVFDRYFPFFKEQEWEIKGLDRDFVESIVSGVFYRFLKYHRIKST